MDNIFKLTMTFCAISIIIALSISIKNPIAFSLVALLAMVSLLIFKLNKSANEKHYFYEQIIDAFPQPISVTDMDMNWTFVNKAATEPLGVKREDVLGQQCHNWGANICKTEDCGITCLRGGNEHTFFNQWDKDFKVFTSYLTDLNGKKMGHIEIVQEISEKVALKSVYHDVDEISDSLANGANNLNDASHALTVGSSQQAASITQIGSSVNEILSQASDNASRATKASDVSLQAQDAANTAVAEMHELENAMTKITQSSDAIREIISVINEIASQTNLLALNASIEAARAGEQGRGFAVVADEVRQLAERSTKAANESAEYIQSSVENVNKGSDISQKCVSALGQIAEQIVDISDTVKAIDNASQNQAEGLSQINQGMSEIEEVVHSTATSAEQTSASAKELTDLAVKLNDQLEDMRKIEGLLDSAHQSANEIEIKNVA